LPICIIVPNSLHDDRTHPWPRRLQIVMRWISSFDSYDLIIGAAIALLLVTVAVVALI
jgi:hypothetical protein